MEWPARYRDTAPPPGWQPKSAFFKAIYAKKRRKIVVQEAPKEHGFVLAFCTYCHAAYGSNDLFPNSPCHDTPPLLSYNLESVYDVLEDLVGVGETGAGAAAAAAGEVPSTAAESEPSASEQAGDVADAGASVEGTTPNVTEPEPVTSAADGGEEPPAPSVSAARRPSRAKKPVAAAAA